jgi:hypothetical protein
MVMAFSAKTMTPVAALLKNVPEEQCRLQRYPSRLHFQTPLAETRVEIIR